MSVQTKSTDFAVVDRPNTWKGLSDLWAEIGQQPNTLYGFAVAEDVILTTSDDIHAAQDWAAPDGPKQ